MMRAIGLMSGTSADGIDVAAVDVDLDREAARPDIRVLNFVTLPYDPAVHARLLSTSSSPSTPINQLGELNVAVGEALGNAALEAAAKWDLDIRSVDVIGSHGHTMWHAPESSVTVQIGEPAIIAERTGVTCVADFRVADVALGGQGAPLVPFVDAILFGDQKEYRAALNIGGIANITLLPDEASGGRGAIRALDTGPGNMVIDACMRLATGAEDFDRDGAAAARGTPSHVLLRELLDDDYLRRAAPKSTGRERYGAAYAAHVWERGRELGLHADDVLATVTALTARSIAAQVPAACRRIIASGGGVHNPTLVDMLQTAIGKPPAHARVERSDAYGVDADAKEAAAFAVLACAAIAGRVNHLPATTGATRATVLGNISPGDNYRKLMAIIWGRKPPAAGV
ncbi:MAG TPA: anhydro-N-acetylmuramic acid kinase [Candidatus Eremiobacteraceae bacterium]|nr:anhydro-N-acetylmuramic acid kinase [Candidatus Eremiobacteraceae bacterium]